MSLLSSIATVGSYTMASRVLGFARDILIASLVGAGLVADCFFVAFKLPNFFRRLFAEGAFNAAFVPIFSNLLEGPGSEREARARARAFAEETLAVLLLVLLVFVAAMEAAMPWAMYALAPGFAENPEKFGLAVALTRLTFPYLLFISLVSLLGGVLNSLGRFAAAAATPILLNLTLIGMLLGFGSRLETAGHALAWGVSAAGALQLVWLIAALHRAGMTLRLPRPRLSPGVKRLLRLMAPAALGAGAVQVNLVIDVVLASLLPEGSVSYLYFADRLNQLPIGVVGVAVGTALLPLLSRQVAAETTTGARAQALASQNRAVEFALLLTVPAAAALVAVPGSLIGALFEHGAFGRDETLRTAQALAAYAVGLPAYVLVKVLGPGFYARGDTATPVRVAMAALAVNLVFNLILMGPMKHVGLALATAIAAWVNAGALFVILARRGHFRIDRRLRRRMPRIVAASAVMAAVLIVLDGFLAPFAAGGAAGRIGLVGAAAGLVAAGLVVFAVAARLFQAVRIGDLKALRAP